MKQRRNASILFLYSMAAGLDMGTAIRSFLLLLAPATVDAEAGIVSMRPLYPPETAVLNPA
jgi:hypothetical protein